MRNKIAWSAVILVAATALLTGSFDATAGVGTQGEDQSWIILGKLKGKKGFALTGGSCYTIHSGPFVSGVAPVGPGDNPATLAQGQVATFAPGDACKCLHRYHGTLFGLADIDPTGCGWGCVVPAGQASSGVQSLAEAFDELVQAQNLLAEVLEAPNAGKAASARALLDSSVDHLGDIAPVFGMAARKGKKPKLVRLLEEAITDTDDVIIAIDFSNGGQDGDQILFATLLCDSVQSVDRDILAALKPVIPRG